MIAILPQLLSLKLQITQMISDCLLNTTDIAPKQDLEASLITQHKNMGIHFFLCKTKSKELNVVVHTCSLSIGVAEAGGSGLNSEFQTS